jgi:type VII secretion-associated serine protease mycosin
MLSRLTRLARRGTLPRSAFAGRRGFLRRPGRRGGRALAGVALAAVLGVATSTSAAAAPADSVRDQQAWVLSMLDVQSAWQLTEGANVTVAVIDSGVNPYVSDLEGAVIPGSDFTNLKTSTSDPHWGQHGTWMASIIAGRGDGYAGGDGIIGVAPEAKILSIRVIPDMNDPGYKKYDSEPEGQIQRELAEGITEAVRDHVQVISMSIGYSAPSGAVRAALQDAYDHGIVLVASAGNSGDNDEQHTRSGARGWAPVSFPAEYPGVLSVGAVNMDKQPTSFSSGNLSVKVAAPGEGVPAQGRNGLYYTVNGTSPACALVAGVAALIKSKYPSITPAQVTEALTTTAQQPMPGGSYNVLTGFGIVDAYAALTESGKLMRERPAGSQASLSAHFGGGVAAIPAAPVAPRGPGPLVMFALVAVVSLAAAAGGMAALRRRPRHG